MVMISTHFSFLIYVLMSLWYDRRKIMLWSQEDNSDDFVLQQNWIVQDFLIVSVQFIYFTSEARMLKIKVQEGKDALLENIVKQITSWNKQSNNQIELRKGYFCWIFFFPFNFICTGGLEVKANIIPIKIFWQSQHEKKWNKSKAVQEDEKQIQKS